MELSGGGWSWLEVGAWFSNTGILFNDYVRLNTFFTLIFFAHLAKSVCTICYIY